MFGWLKHWRWSHSLAVVVSLAGTVEALTKAVPLIPPSVGIVATALGTLAAVFLPSPSGSGS